jgi:hypothetical protein
MLTIKEDPPAWFVICGTELGAFVSLTWRSLAVVELNLPRAARDLIIQ